MHKIVSSDPPKYRYNLHSFLVSILATLAGSSPLSSATSYYRYNLTDGTDGYVRGMFRGWAQVKGSISRKKLSNYIDAEFEARSNGPKMKLLAHLNNSLGRKE